MGISEFLNTLPSYPLAMWAAVLGCLTALSLVILASQEPK